MSDLVKRLREIAVIITSRNVMSHWDALMADVDAQYCNEAASEIERLNAELAAAKAKIERAHDAIICFANGDGDGGIYEIVVELAKPTTDETAQPLK